MIEKIIDPIFAPFRALRSLVWNIQQGPQRIKGEIGRAKNEVALVRNDVKNARDGIKNAPGKFNDAKAQAQNIKVPKKKMGLFSFGKKAACESCGQKLHPSWDECPYCGWKKGTAPGAGAPAAGGGSSGSGGGGGGGSMSPSSSGGASPNRTMALDVGGGGAVSGLGMLGWLIPLEGPRIGELIELRGRITVGKSSDNNVLIDDPSISGHHCELQGSAMGFKLADLGSTNGTFVNDKRVASHDLVDNDNVKLGKVRFKFKQRD